MKSLLSALFIIMWVVPSYAQVTLYTNPATGKVGIGTSAPSQPLEVSGVVQVDATGNSLIVIGSVPANSVGFDLNNTSGHEWIIGSQGSSSGTPNSFNIYDNTGGGSRLVIDGSGDVGIGNSTPSYTLQVNGSVAGTSAYVNTSDSRFKRDIQPLNVGLKEVEQLKPVTFEWNKDALKQTIKGKTYIRPLDPGMQGQQIGFVAQEVEKVLPSVIVTQNDADRTKGLKYSELIPVLVKAIQEQQVEIETLKSQLAVSKGALGK